MLSSDNNVETIAQLAEIVKHYLGIQTEYLKLDVVEKLVRLLTLIAVAIVFFLIVVAVIMYFSIALAFWIATYTGPAVAFLVIGGVHLLLFTIFFCYRKKWIEQPLVRLFANILLNK